ncbi:hypothetical protein MAPG_05601 [Magnaporthiopsis poae ATCC 64411]|uniref:beta-glucosidase n=1 Tax=Magnaporthiopsis poae (strain ATCC 64411 / 73-15) TaxID=644358 RepID=A0A0C4DZU3_MAGP6|nr:hypothetical protein MAPG_05601 [Magnaporthiopsis poae ATCC 64411]
MVVDGSTAGPDGKSTIVTTAQEREHVQAEETPSRYASRMLPLLTLAEKASLLAGSDLWRTAAIPRLDGVAAFVSLAATFESLAAILVAECRAKGVDLLLGPTVCISRAPLGGRNFEAYGEDPFLAGKLASVYINALRAKGIGACIKHFTTNDQEHRRFFVDAIIPERALREVHTRPFEIAIRASNPWSLMTAYNKVNGRFCSTNTVLLEQILREEWGWDGLVMSDWFGTNTVVPGLKAGGKHVLQAVDEGLLSGRDVDECVRHVLEPSAKVGKHKIANWIEPPESAVDTPQFRRLLRQAACEGIVLLKNEAGMLPPRIKPGFKVAMIGPNAGRAVQAGGGSSNLEPHYRTVPFDCMKRALSERGIDGVELSLTPGIVLNRYLPLLDKDVMVDPVTGTPGFHVQYWANATHSGEPVFTEHRVSSYIVCYDGLPPQLMTGARYSYRARTTLRPKTTGRRTLSLSTCGPGKLLLEGAAIIDIERHWWSSKSTLFMSYGSPEETAEAHPEAGRAYELELVSVSRELEEFEFTLTGDMPREEVKDGGRIGFREEVREDLFAQAVRLTAEADLVVLVVGEDHEWESETSDMPSMHLPLATDTLVSAVLDANANAVVVNQTGSPS